VEHESKEDQVEGITPEQKQKIDEMTHYEMCALWLYAPSHHVLLQGESEKYFKKVMNEKGGFTSDMWRALGKIPTGQPERESMANRHIIEPDGDIARDQCLNHDPFIDMTIGEED
jgi:hypothetical protein